VIWCLDRGFNSKDNRRYLQRAGGHYIVGEKLAPSRRRPPRRSPARALPGRRRQLEAEGGACRRRREEGPLRHLPQPRASGPRRPSALEGRRPPEGEIASSDLLSANKRRELYDALCTKPVFKGFLRLTSTARSASTAPSSPKRPHFDGKFLLRTSDESSRQRTSPSLQGALTRPSGDGGT